MSRRFLPLGSVVTLKGGGLKLVIIGRGLMFNDSEETKTITFDYAASLYPIGLDVDKTYYFNTEDIDQTVFEGYSDDVEDHYQDELSQILEELTPYDTETETINIDTSEAENETLPGKSEAVNTSRGPYGF
ncbi:DUF4176 domain-containing protein [Weissella muntiaci]|uniref:DUF4176 domain-containing protein n=1 Tax=Weissella muntiaci TaxID=2508881 RepID=A0A6C2C1P3_9LACO|nr:DUF4176 domain-containing protein [Weissella muntiaci]TYC47864.1 DUF4176 domain-containing protein [Weissella muntiaci]